jgi:hypothetical protein
MPAVNEIDPDSFHKIMNNRLFDFWLVKSFFFSFFLLIDLYFEFNLD